MIVSLLLLFGIIASGFLIPNSKWILTTILPPSLVLLIFWALVRSQKHILDIEAPIDAIVQELESKIIHVGFVGKGFSMLEIFDALRDRFALGLPYPQVHSVLVSKLNRSAAWGIHSSDILATFTTLGLIHSSSIDPSYSVLLDYQYTIPNYIYQLTDKGNLLARKLMSQKPKIGKENSPPE